MERLCHPWTLPSESEGTFTSCTAACFSREYSVLEQTPISGHFCASTVEFQIVGATGMKIKPHVLRFLQADLQSSSSAILNSGLGSCACAYRNRLRSHLLIVC